MFLAFALSLITVSWVEPVSFRIDPETLGLLANLGSHAVSVAVPLAGYLFATRGARRRPAAFRVDNGFRADASAHRAGPVAVVLGWAAGAVFPPGDEPGRTGLHLASLGAAGWSAIALIALILVAATTALLGNRPRLTLDPAGLTRQNLFRPVSFAWPDLAAARPVAPGHPLVRAPDPAPPGKLRISDVQVDPAFVAFTIREYIASPEHRDAIGTAPELSRLQLAFGTPAA